MEAHKSSLTALVSAFARAYHTRHDRPLIFEDQLAYELIGEQQYQQIAQSMFDGLPFFSAGESLSFENDDAALQWVVQTHLAPTPLARAAYCEEMLAHALRLGVRQYVILGAGLDTYTFRKSKSMKKLSVFELDHPASQADKRERIAKLGWQLPQNTTLLPIDLNQQSIAEVLTNSSFDPTQRTFYSWLGVTYYLEPDTLTAVLAEIAALSRKGSLLVFDYPDERLFSSSTKRVQTMLQMAAGAGEPMKLSISRSGMEKNLQRFGFRLFEHLTSEEIQQRFFSDRRDHLRAFESVSMAMAMVH